MQMLLAGENKFLKSMQLYIIDHISEALRTVTMISLNILGDSLLYITQHVYQISLIN